MLFVFQIERNHGTCFQCHKHQTFMYKKVTSTGIVVWTAEESSSNADESYGFSKLSQYVMQSNVQRTMMQRIESTCSRIKRGAYHSHYPQFKLQSHVRNILFHHCQEQQHYCNQMLQNGTSTSSCQLFWVNDVISTSQTNTLRRNLDTHSFSLFIVLLFIASLHSSSDSTAISPSFSISITTLLFFAYEFISCCMISSKYFA